MEHHIRCKPEKISRYCLIPGSHERAGMIACHFDNVELVSDSRGYLVYSGTIEGIKMTVASTGMGGPTTAICLEELAHMGADTFIRVGSCGTMQEYVDCGDVIISTGTFRAGGTGTGYLPIEFPAVANYWVTTALIAAAKKLGQKVHVGLGSAGDAFYAPRRDPEMRKVLAQSGIISGEMESDTIYVLAALRGWRAGGLYACDGVASQTKPAWCEAAYRQGEQIEILIAVEAMKALALADQARGA